MSLSLIAGRREQRKHRVHDALRHEKSETGRLSKALDEATCKLVAMATEIDELRVERSRMAEELDKAALDYSDLLGDRDEWREQALALWDRFGPQIAAEENATAVTVPPAYRDTSDPADQATQPIDVKPLWEAFGIGTVTVVDNPDAANPARTTL